MSFLHPWLLLLLILPLALVVWELSRRGPRVPLPLDHSTARPGVWLARLLMGAEVLPALILGVAIILIAGPQRIGRPTQQRILTNIEIVLDVSGSMSSPMASGAPGSTRYTVAMQAINEFCTRRKGDAFGLTAFGGEVVRWVPLTKDLSAINSAPPFLDPEHNPPGMQSTRIGHALRFTQSTLTQEKEGDKLIVLLTDGFSSDLDGGVATTIGQELRDAGIVIYAINVGDGPAPAQLSEVVAPTGGLVFSAQDARGLASIFEHINHMNPVRLKPVQAEAVDHFFPFTVAGLGLGLLHLLCLLGLRYTPW